MFIAFPPHQGHLMISWVAAAPWKNQGEMNFPSISAPVNDFLGGRDPVQKPRRDEFPSISVPLNDCWGGRVPL